MCIRDSPSRLALIWCDHEGTEARYTYADMARLTSQFANLMTTRGLRKGDRVLIMLPRIPAWQIALVGCLKMGLVPIPCVTMLTANDIAYRIEDANAVAVVTSAGNTDKIADGYDLKARISVGGGAGWLDFNLSLIHI